MLKLFTFFKNFNKVYNFRHLNIMFFLWFYLALNREEKQQAHIDVYEQLT